MYSSMSPVLFALFDNCIVEWPRKNKTIFTIGAYHATGSLQEVNKNNYNTLDPFCGWNKSVDILCLE